MLSESGKKLHHFMAVMASQFCSETLEVPSQLGNLHGTFILIMTVLTLFSAVVATMKKYSCHLCYLEILFNVTEFPDSVAG